MLFKLARYQRVKSLFDVASRPFQLQKGRSTLINSPIPVHIHRIEELSSARLLAHREHNMFLAHMRCIGIIVLAVFVRLDAQFVPIDVEVLVGGERRFNNFEFHAVKGHQLALAVIL